MSKFYELNGARLAYRDVGQRVPVVFLHPTPLDHQYWIPLVAQLAGARAILPDFRGHGESELGCDLPVGGFSRVPDAPVLSVDRLATDVLALMDHLKLPEIVLVGCSIGGYVSLELWRRAHQRIRGLAFICSKAQPDAEANLTKRVETIEKVRKEGTAGIFDGNAQTLIGATTRARRPEVVSKLRARMTLTPDAVVAVQAGLATRPDSVPTIASIDAPTLAICGGEDPGVTPTEMQAFQSAPGGCEYHLLPEAGHFAAYEQPQAVAALLKSWLHQFGD